MSADVPAAADSLFHGKDAIESGGGNVYNDLSSIRKRKANVWLRNPYEFYIKVPGRRS